MNTYVKDIWFGTGPNRGLVLEQRPYRGKYKQWFIVDVRVYTDWGSIWMSVNQEDLEIR